MSFFWLMSSKVGAQYCTRSYTDAEIGTFGFLQRAGVLTFLKTSTELQIWFDEQLELTWVYGNNDPDNTCRMLYPMTGIQFRLQNKEDKVSTHYRYQLEGTFKQNL